MEDKNLNNNNEDLQPTDSGETVFYFDNDDSAESATTDENATVTEVDGAVVVEFNGEDDEPAVPEGEIEMVFDAEPEAIETEVFRDIEDITVEEFQRIRDLKASEY